MKKPKYLFIAVIVALSAWPLAGCKGKTASTGEGVERHDRHEEHAPKALYQCPMHPSYTSDKPGECPICGMKLVPVEEGKSGSEMTSTVTGRVPVVISPERQQIIGVKIDLVMERPLTTIIRAAGRIAYDPELYQAEKEYIESVKTQKRIGRASSEQSLVDASVLRLRQLGLNETMIDDLAKAGRPSLNLLLPEETMWVYAQVYEYELEWVGSGQSVSVTALGFPGEVFEGTLKAIDPVIDPMTRTVRIRAEIKNPGKKLKPNAFVNVEITATRGEGLTIPRDAIIDTGTRKIVFVDRGNGVLEPKEVRTGVRLEEYVQVMEGLSEGERVVTSANFLIDSESSLKAAVKQMGTLTQPSPLGRGTEGEGAGGHAGHGQ